MFDSTIMIPTGPVSSSNCIDVQAVNDTVYEGDNSFSIRILSSSPSLPSASGGQDQVDFTIQDPEGLG